MRHLVLVLIHASLIATDYADHADAGPQSTPVDNNLVYEIFVRSFADSNGDGVGDLNGITAKLEVPRCPIWYSTIRPFATR